MTPPENQATSTSLASADSMVLRLPAGCAAWYAAGMNDYDAIRNYTDEEVPAVIERLASNPDVHGALAAVQLPRLHRLWPRLAAFLVRSRVKSELVQIRTVADVQKRVADLLNHLERETMAGFTVSGMENLQPGVSHLFISNHRDIVLDSALLNWALHRAGHATSRTAVGDNLVSTPWVGDLMRLNKSFVVSRSVMSPKAAFKSFSITSGFIRQSLLDGHSVWIAQRQGRAKDADDRTDPAVLKMLTIAFRSEIGSLGEWLQKVSLVPVSISYELDPCDGMKAHELAVIAETGSYQKAKNEDLISIGRGITGYKGRVHLNVGERLQGEFADVEALGKALDHAVHAGMRLYPVNLDAASRCGYEVEPVPVIPARIAEVDAALLVRFNRCPDTEKDLIWQQYANIWRNARDAQTMSGGSSSAASCSRSSRM